MRTCIFIMLAAILLLGCLPAHAWKQDKFMITVWGPAAYTDAGQAAYKGEGYNLTWWGPDNLDVVAKNGLKAMIWHELLLDPKVLDDPEKKAKLDALIDRVKNQPGMGAYYVVDEPGVTAFAAWGRFVEYLRQRDPNHLAFINLYPTYASLEQLNVSADEIRKRSDSGDEVFVAGARDAATQQTVAAYREYLKKYIEVVKPEFICYDHYHFYTGSDGTQYFLNLELIREAALQAKIPFVNTVQSGTYCEGWRLPNKDEMRFLVYTTMAYGGRGISYFTYNGPKSQGGLYQDNVRTPLALDVAALNKEMNILGPELMKLTSTGVYHTMDVPSGGRAIPGDCIVQASGKTPCVLGLFAQKSETDTFMVVSRDYKNPTKVQITLDSSITALKEFNRKTRKWVRYWVSKNGQPVNVDLEPGDGRLFRMVGK